MSRLHLSPFNHAPAGFEHLASLLNANSTNNRLQNDYPAYDIEAFDADQYRITLTTTGFSDNEISVETEDNTLIVAATKPESKEKHDYLHHGISKRNFKRQFKLEEHVKVKSASNSNGLLQIELCREIPEAKKPRKISINENIEQTEQLLKSV